MVNIRLQHWQPNCIWRTFSLTAVFCLQGGENMDSGLSPQDKKDLDKFIKFFALKVRYSCLLAFFFLLVFQFDEEKNWWRLTTRLISSLADRPGDRPSPPRAENLHPLVLVAHWLWLGKVPRDSASTQPSPRSQGGCVPRTSCVCALCALRFLPTAITNTPVMSKRKGVCQWRTLLYLR